MNNNEYVIRIDLSGVAEDKSAMSLPDGASGSTGSAEAMSKTERGVVNAVKGMVSFATVKATADRLAAFEISQVSLRTGAEEYQARQETTFSIISQSVGAGAGLVAAGIAGGPAGLAVAAVGLIFGGVQKAISIAQKQQTLNTERSLENISIGMASVRAGLTGRRNGQ